MSIAFSPDTKRPNNNKVIKMENDVLRTSRCIIHMEGPCNSKHPYVLELGAVKVSSEWRNDKIAHYLLMEAFSHNFVEDHVVVTIVFCWHWDLKNSGLTMMNYQKMMTRLFSAVGLMKRATDDPDITEHPANVLMVRFGKNVPKEAIQRFEKLTFLNRGR